MTRSIPSLVAAACLVVVAGLLGACRALDVGDAPDSDTTEDASAEDAMLKYAACMREHGVPMEDPVPGGRGVLINGQDVDPETAQAAEKKCHHLIEDVLPDQGEMEIPAEQKEALLAQARCMRERGWDIPDPQFDGGRVSQQLGGQGGSIDPEDPKFKADEEECTAESGVEMPETSER